MFDFRFEPTITEIMREPMVRALMKADRVDATAFEARLRLMSGAGGSETVEDGDAEEEVSLPRHMMPPPVARLAAERCCWC